MKIKKIINEALTEANIDFAPDYEGSIYSDDEKLKKIKGRKTDIARTIEMARYARRKAEKEGNQEGVEKMDRLIAQLEEWYEGAVAAEQELNTGSSSEGGNADHDTNKSGNDPTKKGGEETKDGETGDETEDGEKGDTGDDASKKGGKKGDSGEDNGPLIDTDGLGGDNVDKGRAGHQDSSEGGGDSQGGDDADGSKDDKGDEGKGGKGDKGDKEDSEKPEGPGPGGDPGNPEDPEDPEGPGGDPGDPIDPNGPEGTKGKGKKTKGKGDPGDPGEPGDPTEGDDDEEGDEPGEDGGDGSDQEDGEDDDGDNTSPGMPKIKDDKILVDPFSRKIGSQKKLPDFIEQALKNGKLEIEDEWEAFKRIVSKLKGDARTGAKKAMIDYMKAKYNIDLSEALNSVFGEDLLEALLHINLKEDWQRPGSIETISDEEFGAAINSAIDEINTVLPKNPIKPISPEEIDKGIEEINSDPGQDLEDEDAINKQDAEEQARAKEDEIKKYSTSVNGLLGMSTFSNRILRAMADQADAAENPEDTYSVLNRRNDEDPQVLLKGTRDDPKVTLTPKLEVYIDCSGSWTDSDLRRALTALNILAKLVDEKRIIVHVFYFANNVYNNPNQARREGGTSAWYKIQDNIVAHKTNNVVLVTDTDMSGMAYNSEPIYVNGCVWFLWKNSRSPYIVEKIRGRSGVFEFNLWK